jgi:hypothetical protein
MQQPTHPHPPWCQYQHAPADHTHVHTCGIGTVHVNDDVTIDVSLTQEPGDTASPTLVVHISSAAGNLSFETTGQRTWMLAGLFIDATVTHAKTAPRPRAAPGQRLAHEPAPAHEQVNPSHPGTRTPLRLSQPRPASQRWLRRSFRCAPSATNRPDGEDGPSSGPRPDGDAGPGQ